MPEWYQIRADGNGNPELLVQGEIGYWPINAEEFSFQLQQFANDAPVNVCINSLGGDPMTAIQIYSMLKERKGMVNVDIEAYCLSAATLIACAGDTVAMDDNAAYMIHDPSAFIGDFAREEDMQIGINQVTAVKTQMRQIYMAKSGKTAEEITQMMSANTWMTAKEAKAAGFVDTIEKVTGVTNASIDFKMVARAYNVPKKFQQLKNDGRETSPETSQQNANTMNEWIAKIKAALNLGDDKDEADTVVTVKELKAKALKADALQAEITQLNAKIETLEGEKAELQAKLDVNAEAEKQHEDEELDAVLQAAVDSFQVKAGDKDSLKAEYEGNIDALKTLLAHIPEGAHKPGGIKAPNMKASVNTNLNDGVSKYLN